MKLENDLNKDENWKSECHSYKIECDGSQQDQINYCSPNNHFYSEIECSNCGEIFCWECAKRGGYNPYWVECPVCGKIK